MGIKGQPGFEDIFDQHFDGVYSYVAYRVAPDRELARDLTQEVFLAALKNWSGYRADGSPLTWLRSIARNKVADHFRRPKATTPQEMDHLALDIASLSSADRQRRHQAAQVSLAIRRLPPDYAELLEEKYLEELSLKDMATRRATTQKAVESALHRARESFRQIFAKIQNGEGPET